jgi:Effector protein
MPRPAPGWRQRAPFIPRSSVPTPPPIPAKASAPALSSRLKGWKATTISAGVTPAELRRGRERLQQARWAFADPANRSIQISRLSEKEAKTPNFAGSEKGHQFADRIARVRRVVADLKSGPLGESLVTGIQSRADQSRRPTAYQKKKTRELWEEKADHLRHVSIYAPQSGASWSERNFARPIEDNKALRSGGQAGRGTGTDITFDDNVYNVLHDSGTGRVPVLRDDPGPLLRRATNARVIRPNKNALPPGLRNLPPAVILGHELVHAYRAAHGIGLMNRTVDATVSEDEREVRRLQEEFETVGLLSPDSKQSSHPTENDLRREHNERVKRGSRLGRIPLRSEYSGSDPRAQRKKLASLPRARRDAIQQDFQLNPGAPR